jgi:hypothetical protein
VFGPVRTIEEALKYKGKEKGFIDFIQELLIPEEMYIPKEKYNPEEKISLRTPLSGLQKRLDLRAGSFIILKISLVSCIALYT